MYNMWQFSLKYLEFRVSRRVFITFIYIFIISLLTYKWKIDVTHYSANKASLETYTLFTEKSIQKAMDFQHCEIQMNEKFNLRYYEL